MFDINQAIFDEDGNLDEDAFGEYIDDLVAEFDASPEGQALPEGESSGWVGMMLEYGINYPGSTPPDMSLGDFKEVVFELFPRKVSTPAESAPEIVAELRAFWSFLHRQYGLKNAPKILAELDKNAVERLRQALSNPANFGMAKSFFMAATEAGFDMTTQEGIDQAMLAYNTGMMGDQLGGVPDSLPTEPYKSGFSGILGGLPASRPTGKALDDKRKKRKQQRQNRKRNRR